MQLLAQHSEILLLFFGVALLYSSVGFGGGSSYLAILALYGFDFKIIRAISLLCNITVVSNGTFQFYKQGFINFKKMFPLVLMSIPMAYLGGKVPLKEKSFFIILGITLLVAAFLMWFQPKAKTRIYSANQQLFINLILGGSIGFLSGMVGIGGGIFLSPLLYLIRWDEPKNISATASLFILVNSISGLLGQFQAPKLDIDWIFMGGLILAVALGGIAGSYLGTVKLKQELVRKGTALLIAYVSYNLLVKYW